MPGAPPLEAPITTLRGVGPERAAQLGRLAIRVVGDLLLHRPRRYEDRRQFRAIRDLQPGEPALVQGKVVALGVKRWRHASRSVFELILDDGTARLHCRWWNQPYLEQRFQTGEELLAYGKVADLRPRAMDQPETEPVDPGEEPSLHLGRIVPVYPLTEGLAQRWLRSTIWHALHCCENALPDPWAHCRPPDLPARSQALHHLHFPPELADAQQARRRFAFDELLELQLEFQRRRHFLQTQVEAPRCAGDNHLIRPFLKQLHFTLTDAQTRVLREIRHDLGRTEPMRRLLQGDVGSGKTVVAACAALMTLESGWNVALMAPTEILAGQHFSVFAAWFRALGIQVHLHTGTRKTLTEITPPDTLPHRVPVRTASGERPPPTLIIGTHALIESGFALDRLGLVIIDEQHKFGVAQRERLVRKGRYPHLLVMTATPIPRTLGLTLYGDLDLSTIDSLPPGRGRLRTFVRPMERLPKVWAFVREQLARGRQAYVVCPRIEENEHDTVKTVTAEFARVQQALRPYRCGLLHGQLSAEAKTQVMDEFRRGQLAVLVATAIIEVGVDIPNATVMVIESAEQFGLAQLHQLRGRIGRGAQEACCVLVAEPTTAEARRRLQVLTQTQDGFRLAEHDLKLRGPGEMLGREQSGLPSFRFADLAEDLVLIEQARETAKTLRARVAQ
jgi:ATP-dependent DNA helicase RecG